MRQDLECSKYSLMLVSWSGFPQRQTQQQDLGGEPRKHMGLWSNDIAGKEAQAQFSDSTQNELPAWKNAQSRVKGEGYRGVPVS